jgi:hypothetical protein
MIETLYKTKTPQPTAWRQEFFELSLGEQTVDGQLGYFVRETHCWWNGVANPALRVQYTLSPREGFATVEEARSRYELQRMDRARRGFAHSFTPRYDSTKKSKYVLIEPPAKPAEQAEPSSFDADVANLHDAETAASAQK